MKLEKVYFGLALARKKRTLDNILFSKILNKDIVPMNKYHGVQ